MMESDKKFFENGGADQLEKILETAVAEPLRRTELRIASNMAKILQPASEILSSTKNWFPSDTTC